MLRCAFHQTCKFSNSPEVYVYDIVNLFFPTLLQLAELQVVDFNMRVQPMSISRGGLLNVKHCSTCTTLVTLLARPLACLDRAG